jgi:hypothetical protein
MLRQKDCRRRFTGAVTPSVLCATWHVNVIARFRGTAYHGNAYTARSNFHCDEYGKDRGKAGREHSAKYRRTQKISSL